MRACAHGRPHACEPSYLPGTFGAFVCFCYDDLSKTNILLQNSSPPGPGSNCDPRFQVHDIYISYHDIYISYTVFTIYLYNKHMVFLCAVWHLGWPLPSKTSSTLKTLLESTVGFRVIRRLQLPALGVLRLLWACIKFMSRTAIDGQWLAVTLIFKTGFHTAVAGASSSTWQHWGGGRSREYWQSFLCIQRWSAQSEWVPSMYLDLPVVPQSQRKKLVGATERQQSRIDTWKFVVID